MAHWLENEWRRPTWRRFFLWPISAVYGLLIFMRRLAYRIGLKQTIRLPVPVLVVGNLHVGGSGKTPLTLYLAKQLSARGWRPGIISRGYGRTTEGVLAVCADSLASEVGDEPLLMARSLPEVPVWVGRDRAAAGQALLQAHPDVNVLLCDDGLQHYRLARDLSICVMDGTRSQTRALLPAGPLRESWGRLSKVDALVWNTVALPVDLPDALPAFVMQLQPAGFWQVSHPERVEEAAFFQGGRLGAVAGIGHPARFEQTLAQLGLPVTVVPFPDHHAYTPADLAFPQSDAVLMTEKDAVKCFALNDDKLWALRIAAEVSPDLVAFVESRLKNGR